MSSVSQQRDPITEYSILTSYLLLPSSLPQVLSFDAFLATCVPSQHRSQPHIKRLYRDLQLQRNIDVDAIRENIERECSTASTLRGRLAASILAEGGTIKAGQTTTDSKKRKRKGSIRQHISNNNDEVGQENSFVTGEPNNPHESNIAQALHGDPKSLHPSASSLSKSHSQSQSSTLPPTMYHTVDSLLSVMDQSILSLKKEIESLESDGKELLDEMNETVGQLSDLRYGRFAKPVGATHELDSIENRVIETLEGVEKAARQVLNPQES